MRSKHGLCRMHTTKRTLNPHKLLHSKWTAVTPSQKEKHFMVTQVIIPDPETRIVTAIELEAVITKRTQQLPWRDLLDTACWRQGWL